MGAKAPKLTKSPFPGTSQLWSSEGSGWQRPGEGSAEQTQHSTEQSRERGMAGPESIQREPSPHHVAVEVVRSKREFQIG